MELEGIIMYKKKNFYILYMNSIGMFSKECFFSGWAVILGQGFHGTLKFFKRNLFVWRHFEMISERWFRRESFSARAIVSFSVRHKSHLREPHLYGDAFAGLCCNTPFYTVLSLLPLQIPYVL